MNRRLNKAGFTLIEVLAAMAVLMIIVLMLTRVFRDATSTWTIGTQQVEDNINGRAVLDFIARDISQAMIIGTGCCFRLGSSVTNTYQGGWKSDELCFVALSGATGEREAKEVIYYVGSMVDKQTNPIPNRYCLKRAMRTSGAAVQYTCYNNEYWWEDIPRSKGDPVIAENIATFVVWCTGATNDALGNASYWHGAYHYNSAGDGDLIGAVPSGYDKNATITYMRGKLPVRIDLYLEMLGEDTATKAAQLHGAGLTAQGNDLINQNVRKYFTRVFFVNRTGTMLDW